MSDDLDAMFEIITQQERADIDRQHGEHILNLAAASLAPKKGSQRDPLLELVEKAHRSRLGDDKE